QLTVILEEDTTIEAEFDIKYNIDINFINGEGVVRELRPMYFFRWRTGENKYFIAIVESEGYQIDRWEMQSADGFLEINEKDKIASFGSNQKDIVINIYFKPSEHELKINKDGKGNIIVDIPPNENNKYEYASVLNISVTPDEGWIFLGFRIDETNNAIINNNFAFKNKLESDVIINADFEVTAIFQKVPWAKNLIDQGFYIESNNNIEREVIARSVSPENGTLSYNYGNNTYLLLPGNGIFDSDTKKYGEKGNPVLLKKVNNKLELIKIFKDVSFELPRNYSIFHDNTDMIIVIGDASENVPGYYDTESEVIGRNGDIYAGKILGDVIEWKKINDNSSRNFWHGHAIGDINFDGLYDIISSNTVFIQEVDGNFSKTNYNTFNNQTREYQEGIIGEFIDRAFGGTIGIADLNNDGKNEIIEPSGSGPEYPESKYNNGIIIYEFSEVTGYYEPVFRSEDAFSLYSGINGGVYLEALDLNNDGLKDLAISKEGLINNSEYGKIVEIWINKGDFQFERKDFFSTSPAVPYVWGNIESGGNYEFRTFDVNKDGFMDIVFNGSRSAGFVSWDQSTENWNQWSLNPLIWLNDGTGNFNMYNDKDLTVYAYPEGSDVILPQAAIPYINQDGDLSFFIYVPSGLPGDDYPPYVRYIDVTPDL
ncbi:MAG: VCBS repeat-containing protein, partial [Candidatus Neomarinimicrobiota bacterium]